MGVDDFIYNAEHQVVICRACGTCLVPDETAWKRHLRREPHLLKGEGLAASISLLHSFRLAGQELLKQNRPDRKRPCREVEGLQKIGGYICVCEEGCDFCTQRLKKMRDHVSKAHERKASRQTINGEALWRSCKLQSYFSAKGMIDYFVVQEEVATSADDKHSARIGSEKSANLGSRAEPLWVPETALFRRLKEDMGQARYDLGREAATVNDPGDGRADREPWLVYTGFPLHLQGLSDAKIRSSYQLPQGRPRKASQAAGPDTDKGKREGEGEGQAGWGTASAEELDDLHHAVDTADRYFAEAYQLVADRSLKRKLTYQRAQRLSDFAWGAGKKGKDTAFRAFKNKSTLTSYYRRMKELLVYFYRVAYCNDGHFREPAAAGDSASAGRSTPEDAIEPTTEQLSAMRDILEASREERSNRKQTEGREASRDHDISSRLACAFRRFYVGLICHKVGSHHFRSPVLSFCAMLSRRPVNRRGDSSRRKKKAEARGTGSVELDEFARRQNRLSSWMEPGNFSSDLSALIWMAQLAIFEAACHHPDIDNDEDQILGVVERMCRGYLHQANETTFGYILQWRLYLATVASSAISHRQARWSLDGQEISLSGTSLRMDDVSKLIVSEFRRAQTLLHEKLLLGSKEARLVEAWTIADDLDQCDYGGSWLTDGRNADLLHGSGEVLLREIETRPALRRLFVRDSGSATTTKLSTSSKETGSMDMQLCQRAIAVYEADVQEFLRSMAVLLHIPCSSPTRVPELLAITCSNSTRQRSMVLWENMLMVYIRYHKSQELTGRTADNIRLVPNAIAALVLTYLAVVQPLRLTFLRQIRCGALLSPYLFSTLEGVVWKDDSVTRCLGQACRRAGVPEFNVAWWRQAAASITKEKFSAKERVNFDLEDPLKGPGEIADEEALMADLAEASNHSFRTFNHAYAGSTTLGMSTLLHRAYRASQSWRTLFQVDELLAREVAQAHAGSKRSRPAELELDDDGPYTYKKMRLRTRPLCREEELLAVARNLYNEPDLQFRAPGQRNAILASMGKKAAEQVVVVLGTGSGKSLISMVGAALDGAGTTIVILPTVALRGNFLERLRAATIRTLVWCPGQKTTAPLVLVSAEAACSQSFEEYVAGLQARQVLDRIIVDECHLTITASDYRRSMKQLGWHVRRVATQTIWLTATLPPVLESEFIERNLLVRPHIVRESTNRANIQYSICRYASPGGVTAKAAELVGRFRSSLIEGSSSGRNAPIGGEDRVGSAKARMIVYCQTKVQVLELADSLGCRSYIGDTEVMVEEEKEEAIREWLGPAGSPVIVATSALGVGFDYPQVRWVIHAGQPRKMTDFSQESGRAGRDGLPARSIVLLSQAWKPRSKGQEPRDIDEETMQLYLSGAHCLRSVMSQFLDAPGSWRWCMEGEDELCDVCPAHHVHERPRGPLLQLPATAKGDVGGDVGGGAEGVGERAAAAAAAAGSEGAGGGTGGAAAGAAMNYTGPAEVHRRMQIDEERLTRFLSDMEVMRFSCLLCRVSGRGKPFDHKPATCGNRWGWINAKKKVMKTCRREGKDWMASYTACFTCYMPQSICRAADPEADGGAREGAVMECRYRDMIMPLCYGAFYQAGPRAVIKKEFPRPFRDVDDYMRWLGGKTEIGGQPCTQAVLVAVVLLDSMA